MGFVSLASAQFACGDWWQYTAAGMTGLFFLWGGC